MADDENEESAPLGDGGQEDEEDCPEGIPEWMATFADLVTLLMCFFVLMFAMSSTQQESFKELVQSLKSALGVQQVPEAGTREGLEMVVIEREKQEDDKSKETVDDLGTMVQKEVDDIVSQVKELVMFNQLGGNVSVSGDESGATITISDVLLFPPGDAQMNQSGLDVMKKIADVLRQFSYFIIISGHTDNIPIHTAKYASNWELSANRACEVVRFLIEQGIDPYILSAQGYSFYRPIATNDTEEGRAQNRRVEIKYERQKIYESFENKIN